MNIKIERYYDYPAIVRQTPNQSFQWKEFTFTEDPCEECDYLVILDYPKNDFTIKVNPRNIIHLALEPANEMSLYRQFGNKQIAKSFNQLSRHKYGIRSQGALPWHINKDFDYLSTLQCHDLVKEDKIVWITSNQTGTKGHKMRMDFLHSIQNLPFVDIYGRGIKPIADKWDGLCSAKYAIAYENFKSEYYWTEKITDCFLSYTMPTYYGCENIGNFFPKNSFIQIDPKDKHVSIYLQEIAQSSLWEQNIESIVQARNLVLNEYQLFPFLYNQIKAIEASEGSSSFLPKKSISFRGGDDFFDNYPIGVYLDRKILQKLKSKMEKLFNN